MNKFAWLALAATALAWSDVASATTQVADGGFETQGDPVGSFCYFDQGNCPAGPWTGAGAGLQFEGNGAWPGAPTPDGDSYGFIQSGGFLDQVFSAAETGVFNLSWLDAGRPQGGFFTGNQTYDVRIGSLVVGQSATTSFQPFTARTSGAFNLFAGQSYTLRFQGTNLNGGDNTAFIDQVALNYLGPIPTGGVPEPATWALMILGFGAAGHMLRRRRGGLSAAFT